MYKKVIISKKGDEPMELHYEVGKGIETEDYNDLFNNFSPNFDFSLADKLIQDFSSDIIPSFKKSSLFTNNDLEEMIRPFKDNYIIKKKNKKKHRAYFKPMTRRNNRKSKQNKKNKKNKKNVNKKIKTQKSKKIARKKGNNKK